MENITRLQQDTDEQAAVFGALADPTRLKLVKLLCQHYEANAICVNALANFLGVSQSAVSQHLRVLKAIGLVKGERRGYHIHYSIKPEALQRYRELVLQVMNIGDPSEEKPCNDFCSDRRK